MPTYFVAQQDPRAADAHPGSEALPWQTLTQACRTAQADDLVWVKQGVYRETLAPAGDRVTFRAYGDDQVAIAPPDGERLDPAGWQKVPGTASVYQITAAVDPQPLLRVDGLALAYEQVTGTQTISSPIDGSSRTIELRGALDDSLARRWTALDGGILQINLGGDDPARHDITLAPAVFVGINISTNDCRVSGLAIRDASTAIAVSGANNVISDCTVTAAFLGVLMHGRSNVLRRCTLLRCWVGIDAGDCQATHLMEENFIIGTGFPVWRNYSPQTELANPWRSGCSVRYGNTHFCIFRHNVISDGAWAGWWPDVNCYGNYYYGNTMSRITDRGIYNEYPANDSRILYNAVVNCTDGITYRFSWHTMALYNYLANNTHAGLTIWGPHIDNPYLFDNQLAKNVVFGSQTCVVLRDNEGMKVMAGQGDGSPVQTEMPTSGRYRIQSNSFEKNRYRIEPNGIFAEFNDLKFATLDAFQQATGMEQGSQLVAEPEIESLALGLYTVRVPESSRPYEAVPLVGNPVRQGMHIDPLPRAAEDSPYFWKQGDADQLSEGTVWNGALDWQYEWPHCGRSVNRLIRAKPGADPFTPLGANDEPQVWLECVGHIIDEIPANGSGFWSQNLPTVPGATIRFSFQVSGEAITPKRGSAGPVACFRFQSLTGQRVEKLVVFGTTDAGETIGAGPTTGSFPWYTVHSEVTAPADAKRFAIFIGLKPAEGAVRFANMRIETLPAPPPPVIAPAETHFVSLDLSAGYNHDLDHDSGGALGAPSPSSFEQGCCYLPLIDLSTVTAGDYRAGAVPFQVSRAITLRNSRRPPYTLPLAVDALPVRQCASALYFLHAGPTHYIAREYWRYLVHYADGVTLEVVPIRDEVNRHYYGAYFLPGQEDIAVATPFAEIEGLGEVLRWSNPRPDTPIATVDFRSMDNGQAVLLAITAGS
jgi:hypothetical protein